MLDVKRAFLGARPKDYLFGRTQKLAYHSASTTGRETWQEYFTEHPDLGGVPKSEIAFLQRHAPCLSGAFMERAGELKAFRFMGAPGSGKTKLRKFFDRERGAAGYLIVNPDDYKVCLPEYAGGAGADLVHEESSWLAQQSRNVAIARGCGLMNDAVGANAAKYTALVGRLRANGYGVELGCVHLLDANALLARVVAKAKATGRVVPESVVRDAHQKIPSAFSMLSQQVDAAFLFDGATGELAWERVSRTSTVRSPSFLAKLTVVLPS